ncbi:MAG: hypothetical protein O7D94_08770 [Planctomycetota bacterium]|nr:hypothetical protein [Planctomycetota bacterium]MCZ6699006.1 hypothetical protein [Planctomycetota bacterium]
MILLLNILLPGTGLIVRRREWLGLCLVMLYGVCANVALASRWIAPESIPRPLGSLALTIAACAWILSQALYRRQGKILARQADSLAMLLKEAETALLSGDIRSAQAALLSGAAVDNEDPRLHALMKKVQSIEPR